MQDRAWRGVGEHTYSSLLLLVWTLAGGVGWSENCGDLTLVPVEGGTANGMSGLEI